MSKLLAASLLACTAYVASAQTQIHWERSFGGADADFASVAVLARDGGYILGGYSYSEPSGTKSSAHRGGGDFWIVKLDASGVKQWDSSFGGNDYDGIHALQQTADGGFILGGVSYSGASGNKSSAQHGDGDYWIVKINASGNKQWDRAFGGSSNDVLHSVQQAADGGYILGGSSASPVSGNKTSANYGATDYWIVKLDASGNKQWERSLGGNDAELLRAVHQARDGGYLVGGNSTSSASGNKASGTFGDGAVDGWLVKLDGNGQKQWELCLGGDDSDELCSVEPTSNGGFIVGGTSDSEISGNKSTGGFGGKDYWIMKVGPSGQREWDRSFGGDEAEELHSVHQTSDGGYILGGFSSSGLSGNKGSSGNTAGSAEYWMLKLDSRGEKQWEQSTASGFASGPLRLLSVPGGYALAGCPTLAIGEADSAITKFGMPLFIHSFVPGQNRSFQAEAYGIPGAMYALEETVNFGGWTTIASNTANSDGVVTFSGTFPMNVTKRFFRVRKQS